jgi:hypothetical protein
MLIEDAGYPASSRRQKELPLCEPMPVFLSMYFEVPVFPFGAHQKKERRSHPRRSAVRIDQLIKR